MADVLLQDGDLVLFSPSFLPAVVMVLPGKLAGSGKATRHGKALCVEGDEKQVAVHNCAYITPAYPLPGTGTLKIQRLAGDQRAQHTRSGGKAVLLKGGSFTARFEVQSPAQLATPSGPQQDSLKQYSGSGQFMPLGPPTHRGT